MASDWIDPVPGIPHQISRNSCIRRRVGACENRSEAKNETLRQ